MIKHNTKPHLYPIHIQYNQYFTLYITNTTTFISKINHFSILFLHFPSLSLSPLSYRVSVASPRDILARRAILQRERRLCNHLARIRPHNVHAQHAVRLGVAQNLHGTFGILIGARAAVGHKRKVADAVLHALALELLLGLADPRDLGVRVDDARDGVVVDVAVLAGDVFDARDAFFFGLVGEHRAGDHVADGVDAGHVRLEEGVGLDAALVVDGDAGFLKAEAVGEGAAANREKHNISINLEEE